MVIFLLSFVKGSKSAEGGKNPPADMDPGGPNPLADMAYTIRNLRIACVHFASALFAYLRAAL